MRALLPALALLALAACQPPGTRPSFDWAAYEANLLQHTKHPERASNYAEKLRQSLEAAQDRGCIPPGLCAEYGFLLLTAGQPREAAVWLEKEKALFPASAAFVDRLLARTRPGEKPS